jgi:hypothetical protein
VATRVPTGRMRLRARSASSMPCCLGAVEVAAEAAETLRHPAAFSGPRQPNYCAISGPLCCREAHVAFMSSNSSFLRWRSSSRMRASCRVRQPLGKGASLAILSVRSGSSAISLSPPAHSVAGTWPVHSDAFPKPHGFLVSSASSSQLNLKRHGPSFPAGCTITTSLFHQGV